MKKILLILFLSSSLSACVLDRIENRVTNSSLTNKHRGKAGMVIGAIAGGVITKLAAPKIKSLYNRVYNWFKKDKI